MPASCRTGLLACLFLLFFPSAHAQILRGKVVMPDATSPTQRVFIERVCPGVGAYQEAITNKHGEYFIHTAINALGVTQSRASNTSVYHCTLRARMKGFESNAVDLNDPRVLGNPVLPLLTLRPLTGKPSDTGILPKSVIKSWESGAKALEAEQWAEAERLLRDVTRAAPQFAPAWTGTGMAAQNQQRPADARQAYQRAISIDAAALQPRLFLTRLEISAQRWTEAAASAEALITADTNRRYPEAFLAHAIARYQSNQLDAAHTSLTEAIRLDTRRQLPQAEYFLGAVLAGKGDRAAAADHLRTYLELAPAAPAADLVRHQIDDLSRAAATPQLTLRAPDTMLANPIPEPEIAAAGEAWVPGGRKALAAVARMKSVPAPHDFFLEYARTVAAQTSRLNPDPIAGYAANLIAFVTAIAELNELGDRRPDRTVLHLALAPADLPKTERILAVLGWKVFDRDDKPTIEPGDQAADGPRQQIPPALGIDEIAMQSALESGRPFEFEIFSETATLAGGAAWGATLEGFTTLPGGIAEAFVRQPRLAKTYAGLAAMGLADGLAFARRTGLRVLVANHADALWLYSDAFRVFSNQAVVPGGPAAGELWTKLAGTSPRDAAKFFQAVLTVDKGRLAAFYSALGHADLAHRMFFTRNLAVAQRYYAWYRDSEELREGIGVPQRVWRPAFFQKLPLDNLFPGGRTAWSQAGNDDDALLAVDQEALLAAAHLKNLPAESAKLFVRHFNDWRGILPYFEALPAIGPDEFEALAAFTAAAPRNDVIAEWHARAALLVHDRKAGLLDDAEAARAFRNLCRTLIAPDHKTPDLPRLVSRVYETLLPPDTLLLNEDPALPARHVFVAPKQPLFQPALLVASSAAGGSHFSGGFAGFEDIARKLPRIGDSPKPGAAPATPSTALFRADARLVEAHTTVTDEKGRYVDGLTAQSFVIRQAGKIVPIAAFENSAAPISCALLLDTSQSMDTAVPALKSAALKLIAALRANDTVAVYSLNEGISLLQPFTTDKVAATRAVLRVELGSQTALYDGLIRVNRDLSTRTGRKVIVVFTDGEDNASTLPAATAILRAKTAGVPIYTIAQGHAVRNRVMLKDLSATSQSTGALSFSIQSSSEIGDVFDKVLQDLLHGYLLAFSPPPADDHDWRPIQVQLSTPHLHKVRSREGYYPW